MPSTVRIYELKVMKRSGPKEERWKEEFGSDDYVELADKLIDLSERNKGDEGSYQFVLRTDGGYTKGGSTGVINTNGKLERVIIRFIGSNNP